MPPQPDISNSVAITGIGLRVPGASSRDEFWRLLCSGATAIETARADHDPAKVHAAGRLKGIDGFDAGRFGLSRAEAEMLDPQHRIFLECCVEALDDAGLDPFHTDSNVAVFAGCSSSSYLLNQVAGPLSYRSRPDELLPLLGNDKDYLCLRISYLLNLRGPSMNVQTACSTSLVAVHLACQSLLSQECDAALVGGVTIRVPQDMGYRAQEGGYLSPLGECRPFDARASGAVFGNGAGCVVLKRTADAMRDGSRIYACILGSAVNNDGGAKAGFTAPSLEGQMRVLAETYAVAGVDPASVSLIEAHGTGTALGDPIEVSALRRVLDPAGRRVRPCAISSVKGATGHLESAAGIVGLIKASLCLWYGLVPPQAGFSVPGPLLELGAWLSIPQSAQPWTGEERYAGVSSFGIGGTNAHVVLGAGHERAEEPMGVERDELLALSGRDQADLEEQSRAMAQWLRVQPEASLGAIAFGMGTRRSAGPVRRAVVGRTRDEWCEQLEEVIARRTQSSGKGWVWVYSGQGGSDSEELSERWEELRGERWFREELELWEREIEERTGWRIGPWLRGQAKPTGSLWQKQLVKLVWQMGVTAQLRGWGLEAGAVVGHSVGEVAAAVAAGAMDRGQGVEVVWRRGLLLEKLQGLGGMVAVRQQNVSEEPAGLSLAARNGPSWKVWSGPAEALEQWYGKWQQQGLEVRWIDTMGVAGHGPEVEQGARQLERELAGQSWSEGLRIPMRSTVTGEWLKSVDATYWRRNLRETVRFDLAIEGLIEEGFRQFVEVGAQPVLGGAIEEQLESVDQTGQVQWSLRRGETARRNLLEVAGRAYESGQALAWANVTSTRAIADLPPVSWRRQSYWFEAPHANDDATATWLGNHVESSLAPHPHFWQTEIHPNDFWRGHALRGEAIFPATGYLELVRGAHADLTGIGRDLILEDVRFLEFLPLDRAAKIQTCLQRIDTGFRFSISSKDSQSGWIEHARGTIAVSPPDEEAAKNPPAFRVDGRYTDPAFHYDRVRSWGIEHGGPFRGLGAICTDGVQATAEIALPGGDQLEPPHGRIAWLDSALQLFQSLKPGTLFPVRIARIHLTRWEPIAAHVMANANGSLIVATENGQQLIRVEGLELKGEPESERFVHVVTWRPATGNPRREPDGGRRWRVYGDSAAARELQRRLGDPGAHDRPGLIILESAATDALNAARELVRRDPRAAIWWLTSGAVSVNGDPVTNPNGALFWGLGRVFANEYREAAIGIADWNTEADLAAFARDLEQGIDDQEAAYRGGQRWTPSSERVACRETPAPPIQTNASYWITGGRGGLGLASAEWLAAHGARYIVLMSRGPADLTAQQRLRATGAEIVNLQVDVANFGQLEQAAAQLSGAPPLKGILHAAGHLCDGLIENLDDEQMRAVLAPKVEGAWNLHRLTRDLALDFFVCYSSIGSLIGPPGQASHAAANAFLDAFAHYRRGLGLAALSVNWGPWSQVGHSAARGLNESLAAKGLRPISRETAFSALAMLLSQSSYAQAGVFDLDVELWRRSLPGFAQPADQRPVRLRAIPPGKAGQRAVEAVVARQAARILRMTEESISPERPLREYGLDSLRSFELRNLLESAFGSRIPATAVWRHNTVRAIAGYCRTLVENGAAH